MKNIKVISTIIIIALSLFIIPVTIYAQSTQPNSTKSLEEKCSNTGPSVTIKGCSLADRISDPSGFVAPSWSAVRASINIILLIALLLISFTNILRINLNTYEVKKALPNLVIGVILANASFLVIRYLADIATVTVYFFVEDVNASTLTGFISTALSGLTVETIGTIGGTANNVVATTIILFLFTIVLIVGLLWLAVILYARLVVIYLLTILAPLAFVSYGIPGFDKYFKQWWQQFIKWMFMLPAMSAIFWIMIKINQAGQGGEYSLAKTIILFFLLFTAVSLPTKLGGKIAENVTNKLKNNFATKAGKQLGKDAGSWTASRLPGVYRTQEWLKLSRQNFEKDLKNRREAAAGKARRGLAGAREENLDLSEEAIKGEEEIEKIKRKGAARAKHQMGEQLARLADEKKIVELGLESQKLEEQRTAIAKSDVAQRKIRAEYEKTEVESRLNGETNKQKLDFVSDNNNKDFLKRVHAEVNEADHYSGAITKEENITKGNLAQEELILSKRVDQYHELQEIIDDKTGKYNQAQKNSAAAKQQTIEADYKNLSQMPGHNFYKNLSIQQAAKHLKDKTPTASLIKAKKDQSKKAVDAGVAAANKESVESETFEEAQDAIKDLTQNANWKNLVSGDTIGFEAKDQFQFESYTHKITAWSKDRDNPNRDRALVALAELHLQTPAGASKPFTVNVGRGKKPQPITFNNADDVEKFLSTSTDDNARRSILKFIAKENPYLVGTGGYKSGSTPMPT